MTYLRVLQEIGSMVGDPTLIKVKDLARIAFINAIATLVREGKYSEDDIPGFIKAKTDVKFTAGSEDINALRVFKILDFYMPPGTDADVIITYQETPLLNKISALETLQPSMYDLFIYKEGNTLKAYTGATPVFILGTTSCTMKYIKDIDDEGWLDSTDLQAAAAYVLTTAFTRTAIQLAGASLSSEAKK